jgi:hypothetical protein
MTKEIKGCLIFLIIIGAVFVFTFTVGDEIHYVEIQRSDKDVITELRFKLGEEQRKVGMLSSENRMLRRIVHGDKYKVYSMAGYLIDVNTRLMRENAELRNRLFKKK